MARHRALMIAPLLGSTCSVVCVLLLLAVPGRAVEDDTVATVDRLFARVALVRKEIESIRLEMGKPRSEALQITVTGAGTREAYFAAQNMFEKANQLSLELTRETAPTPESPIGEILPFDVSVVITAALVRLREVKARLAISEPSTEPPVFGLKTPGDVFVSVIEANRQLDLLLDQGIRPSEVFQKVTLAVGYAARLLARFPGQSRIPDAPPLERQKFPADIYRRLLLCFAHVRALMQDSGLDVLELHTSEAGYDWVTLSDTYELASLLVVELSYVHSQLPAAQSPRNVYYPGRKLPSDVYQRAGILEAQLRNLSRWVARNRRWLTRTESE